MGDRAKAGRDGSSPRCRRPLGALARAPPAGKGQAARGRSVRSSSPPRPGRQAALPTRGPLRVDGRARGPPQAGRCCARARTRPAAATIPAWRIAPPNMCLKRRASKHQLGGAGDDGAERAAEALRQADRHRVGALGDPRRRDTERDGRVEEPSAVEMEPETELAAAVDDGVELLERPDTAAGGVVGVLDGDDSRPRCVEVAVQARGRADLVGADSAVLTDQRARLKAAEDSGAPELRDQDVRMLLGEQLVARLAVEPERDLVRHCRRRDIDGLFLPEKLSRPLLEQVDGRVFPLLLVADLRGRHRLAHRRARLRLGIRPEVDHGEILPAARRGGTGQRRSCL